MKWWTRSAAVRPGKAFGAIIPGCQAGSQTMCVSTRVMPSTSMTALANAVGDDALHRAARRRQRVRDSR